MYKYLFRQNANNLKANQLQFVRQIIQNKTKKGMFALHNPNIMDGRGGAILSYARGGKIRARPTEKGDKIIPVDSGSKAPETAGSYRNEHLLVR